MRTDVKIGLFLGIAALLLAVWFCWPTGTNRTSTVGKAGEPVTASVTPMTTSHAEQVQPAALSPIGPSVAMGSPSIQVPADVSASPEVSARAGALAPAIDQHTSRTEASGPAAIGREPLVHIVGQGQTLEQIADLYYKDGDKPYDQTVAVAWLRQANPRLANGKQVHAGMKIKIPAAPPAMPSPRSATAVVGSPTTQSASAATTGSRSYTVQRGDTLYSIASKQLGTPKRWHEVLDLNAATLNGKPQSLRPGQILRLPG